MKALTIQQPWAWSIIYGGKPVENRSQLWSYRGPLGIHAGLQISPEGKASHLVRTAATRVNPDLPVVYRFNGKDFYHQPSLHRGAFIGVVDLVDVHWARPAVVGFDGSNTGEPIIFPACCDTEWAEFPWYGHKRISHLVLSNPRPLEQPIPYRGRLGLWNPPVSIVEQLERACGEVMP